MTYPLGCFPCAFLRCEMWEQKAALEKGIYGLIVGWSWVEPGLGLGDSYGSFAIWDSLQFCNNLMAQPGYSTPAVRPEGLQDPTCRRWRCTSPAHTNAEPRQQILKHSAETSLQRDPRSAVSQACGRTRRKAAAEGRDGHSDFSVGEVIIFPTAPIAIQEMLQGKRWGLTWNETSGPGLHRTPRSGRRRARGPHTPLPTAVRAPCTAAPGAQYSRYSRCPAARRSSARHSMAKSPRTGVAHQTPATDRPAKRISAPSLDDRCAPHRPLSARIGRRKRGGVPAGAHPRPVAGKGGLRGCWRARVSAQAPLGRCGGRTAARARWAVAGFAMAAGGKSFLADAGYGEQELDANSALMELDKGEARGWGSARLGCRAGSGGCRCSSQRCGALRRPAVRQARRAVRGRRALPSALPEVSLPHPHQLSLPEAGRRLQGRVSSVLVALIPLEAVLHRCLQSRNE